MTDGAMDGLEPLPADVLLLDEDDPDEAGDPEPDEPGAGDELTDVDEY